jgi:methyl-accepting chemotaxis protein
MSATFKRRQYPVVFRDRQYRLLALVLFYIFTIVLIFFIFLFLPDFVQMRDTTVSLELRGHAADRILMLHARLWPAIIAAICLIGLHSFRMFLFLIGPLKRLRWAFEKLGAGELDFKVVLRKGDFLMEEGDLFNRTLGTLADEINRAKTSTARVASALQDLSGDIQGLPRDAQLRLAGHLETLQGSAADVRRSLDFFRNPEKESAGVSDPG